MTRRRSPTLLSLPYMLLAVLVRYHCCHPSLCVVILPYMSSLSIPHVTLSSEGIVMPHCCWPSPCIVVVPPLRHCHHCLQAIWSVEALPLSSGWDYYSPNHRELHLMDLVNFSLLSYLIVSDFEPWGDSLWELTYLTTFTISQTCVCLMANLVLLNLTLFLTVHIHAVHGYAATHAHHTCSMLLFHSAIAMWLYHDINLHYACPKQYW